MWSRETAREREQHGAPAQHRRTAQPPTFSRSPTSHFHLRELLHGTSAGVQGVHKAKPTPPHVSPSKGCPKPKPTPPTPHLLLLPFPFGLALFQLLGLLLGKAHGLCREEILEAFKATVVFFCRGWKGERSPSVLVRTRDTEAEAGSKPPYHPDPTTPDRGHVATVLGQLTTVMSALVGSTGHCHSLALPSLPPL